LTGRRVAFIEKDRFLSKKREEVSLARASGGICAFKMAAISTLILRGPFAFFFAFLEEEMDNGV
jgi:hypothetical protein